MSKKLENVRKKIDALDDRIHDALMDRAALIVDIAAEKRKKNLQFVHPAREAMMIRRLLARHKGALPASSVVRIWRELVGAVSLMQTGLKVSVVLEDGSTALWDMAKNYFGSVVPMQKSSSPLAALASVRENESSFAVLPWPHDGEKQPWWSYLSNHENLEMRIVCALPYGSVEGEPPSHEGRSLVVAKASCFESGEDHSFILMETEHTTSRARIVDMLKALDIEAVSLSTRSGAELNIPSMHLIETKGYIAEDAECLKALEQKFEDQECACRVVGGFPIPPVYPKSEAEINAQNGPIAPNAPRADVSE